MPKLGRALRGSSIEAKKPTEPLAALDPTVSSGTVDGVDEAIVDPLVIALAVVVRDVLAHRSPKVRFTNRNDLCQALGLDRSHESLRVRVQIGAPAREPYRMDTGALERCPKQLCEQRIAVVDQVATS